MDDSISTQSAFVIVFGWVLHHTNTVKVIWGLSSFTGKGRPQVPLRALFQAQAVTRVEPLMFRKLNWIAFLHERIQSPWRDLNPQQ